MIVFRLTGFFAARVLLFPLSVRHLILCQIFLSLFADISEREREDKKQANLPIYLLAQPKKNILFIFLSKSQQDD